MLNSLKKPRFFVPIILAIILIASMVFVLSRNKDQNDKIVQVGSSSISSSSIESSQNSNEDKDQSKNSSEPEATVPKNNNPVRLSGRLAYPASYVPPLRVCAKRVSDNTYFCTGKDQVVMQFTRTPNQVPSNPFDFDPNFVAASNKNSTFYLDLTPGKYILRSYLWGDPVTNDESNPIAVLSDGKCWMDKADGTPVVNPACGSFDVDEGLFLLGIRSEYSVCIEAFVKQNPSTDYTTAKECENKSKEPLVFEVKADTPINDIYLIVP